MQSIKVQIKFEIQGKEHIYQCEPNCTWNECCEALGMMKSYAYGRMKEDQDKAAEAQKPEEPKPE